MWVPTPMARSAWPLISASQVPASTSVRRRRRVPGPPARLAGHALRIERVEGLAEFEHGELRHHPIHRDRELGFPAGGDAPHAVGHRVHLDQQAAAFVQQLFAGGGELGLARTAVEQQHVECVFELAHVVGQAPTAPCRARAPPRQNCRCGRSRPSSTRLRASTHCGVRSWCGGRRGNSAAFILFERGLQSPAASMRAGRDLH